MHFDIVLFFISPSFHFWRYIYLFLTAMFLYHLLLNRPHPLADAKTFDIASNKSSSTKANPLSISR